MIQADPDLRAMIDGDLYFNNLTGEWERLAPENEPPFIQDEWARMQAEEMYPVHYYGIQPEYNADTNQDNLNAIARESAAELGLDPATRSTWSLRTRISYIDLFRSKVLARPDLFLPETVAIAQRIDTSTMAPDDSAQFGLAISNVVLGAAAATGLENFGGGMAQALAGVGSGLRNLGSVSGVIVPVAAIAFLYLFVKSTARDARRTFA